MSLKNTLVNLMPNPMVKLFAAPYVAGDSIDSAISTARKFWETRKVRSTIDLLGEELETDEDVQYTIGVYQRLLSQLGRQPFATVSLKPTQLGSHRGAAHSEKIIGELVTLADQHEIPVTIDMEDHHFTDLTLENYRNLKAAHPTLGTVLQSRLFRTRDDILSLRGLNARVRICIGIYNEPQDIALQDKPSMKKKLLEYVELLFDEGHFPEIATHDEQVIHAARELAGRKGRKPGEYEIQMLMGVPRKEIQDELIRDGVPVRLYVPFAEKWHYALSYCKRRMAANPKMALYVMKNLAHSMTGKK